MASFSLIFKLRLFSQIFCMLACPQTPWFGQPNPKKAWKHNWSVNFHKFCCSLVQSCRFRCCPFISCFLLFEWLSDAKILLSDHSVMQNYVSVIFQSQTNKAILTNNWRHVKETIVMKNPKEVKKTSTTWHICLTVWLRSVTLIQSLLFITDNFFIIYLQVTCSI